MIIMSGDYRSGIRRPVCFADKVIVLKPVGAVLNI